MAKQDSVEALAHALSRLRGLQVELKAKVTGLEKEVGLLEARDTTLASEMFDGKDVTKERGRLRGDLRGKRDDLAEARADLALLEGKVKQAEQAHAQAARAAEEAAVPAAARELEAAVAALARDVAAAIREPLARLQQLEAGLATLERRWEALYDRGYTGGTALTRLAHALRALQVVVGGAQ